MKEGIAHVLKAKQLLRAMVSQSVSTYANQVVAFVIPWIVLTKTGSAASAGLVAFAMAVAMLLGGIFGGLATDRLGGRRVSLIADALSLVTALALGVALFVDFFAIWFVIVTQILGIFFDSPGMIAKNTTVPAAAAEANVPVVRATGLQQTLQNVAMFLGPVSAGTLIALLTESTTLMFAAVLFLIAIYLVARMPRKIMPKQHPMSFRQAYVDMKEAVQFLVKDPFLGKMQIFGPFYAFVTIPAATIVFPAWFVFAGESSASLGMFLGAQAVGGVIGGFIFAAYAHKVSQHKWLATATSAYALSFVALSFLQPGSILSIVIGFLTGVIFAGVMAVPYSAFYMRTPEKYLGRAGSLGIAAGSLVAGIASLFFGWFISSTSPPTGLLACAVAVGLVALGTIFFPFMRLLDQPPSEAPAENKA